MNGVNRGAQNNEEAQFRKFATDVNEQNQGYGTKLLSYIIDFLTDMKIKRIWCNARKDKIDFYHRFGMEVTNREFSKDGILYVQMEKKIRDQRYL